jgi:hypothetical protein
MWKLTCPWTPLLPALAGCFTWSLKIRKSRSIQHTYMCVCVQRFTQRFTHNWFIKIRWYHVSHETHHTMQIVRHQHDICITCFKTDQNDIFIHPSKSLWPIPVARHDYDCVFQVKMQNTGGSAATVHLFVQESLDDTPAFPVNCSTLWTRPNSQKQWINDVFCCFNRSQPLWHRPQNMKSPFRIKHRESSYKQTILCFPLNQITQALNCQMYVFLLTTMNHKIAQVTGLAKVSTRRRANELPSSQSVAHHKSHECVDLRWEWVEHTGKEAWISWMKMNMFLVWQMVASWVLLILGQFQVAIIDHSILFLHWIMATCQRK